jgi:hypothetical protein
MGAGHVRCRMPESLEQLDLLLLTVARARKVRIMRINDLAQVTKDVVESARESLVIGPE